MNNASFPECIEANRSGLILKTVCFHKVSTHCPPLPTWSLLHIAISLLPLCCHTAEEAFDRMSDLAYFDLQPQQNHEPNKSLYLQSIMAQAFCHKNWNSMICELYTNKVDISKPSRDCGCYNPFTPPRSCLMSMKNEKHKEGRLYFMHEAKMKEELQVLLGKKDNNHSRNFSSLGGDIGDSSQTYSSYCLSRACGRKPKLWLRLHGHLEFDISRWDETSHIRR